MNWKIVILVRVMPPPAEFFKVISTFGMEGEKFILESNKRCIYAAKI